MHAVVHKTMSMLLNARHTQRRRRKPATVYVYSYYLPSYSDITTHNTDAILQAYRLLGLVLRPANFEPNKIALGISGTAVVSRIAIPEKVSLSSLQFQVSHNTSPCRLLPRRPQWPRLYSATERHRRFERNFADGNMRLLYGVAWLLVLGLMLIGSPSVRGDDVGGLSGEAAEEDDDVTQLRHHRRHHHRHQQQQANDSVIERQQWINRQRLSLTLAETGVKLRAIPPDLRSGTSRLRSTTSNNRSGTSHLRSGTFLLGSTTLHSLHLVGGREPHLCIRPFGLELRPFKPLAYKDPPLLAE